MAASSSIAAPIPRTRWTKYYLNANDQTLRSELETAPGAHDEIQPLRAGNIYELDIELWPTSLVLPLGARIALSVRGKDYVYPGVSGGKLSNMRNEFTGCGPWPSRGA
jgi:hypothetical protein